MSEATRQKKEAWLRESRLGIDYHPESLLAAVIRDQGMGFFTDEQIDDLTQAAVTKLRRQNRMKIENRRIYAAQKKQEAA